MKGKVGQKMNRADRGAMWAAFLIPLGIMLGIFIGNGIFPFGNRSFLVSDMYHQYMPFFSELLRKIRAGESLAFSYNVGIGSNFMALFVYYLASPLHIFSLLVPEGYLMEFMSYLVVLKIGLAGLTAYSYLRKHFSNSDRGAVLFSCFYALSGYVAAYNYNIMWIDCVVLLPLIVLGLERLVKEGKGTLYGVTLGISIFTNFYISIMICIFLVLYFVLLWAGEKRKLRALGKFLLYSLLAGGMAAVLLIPEVCAILETDFGDMDFPKVVESYFPVLDMLARHCMCVFTERGLDHWPNLYCGVAAIMLVPVYAMNKHISIREKFSRLALIGFMLLSFSTNMLDFIWHGLNYPDSFPGRQSFIYILLVLTICYDAYLHIQETEKQHILYGYLCAVGALLFWEKFVEHEDFQWGIKLLTLGFITVYAVLLWKLRAGGDVGKKRILAIVSVALVIAESCVNMAVTSVGTVSRSEYLGQLADYNKLYEATQDREEGLYRLEKFHRKTKNDGTLAGYPTASLFSSTLNSQVMDMYKRLGMGNSKVYYCFDGATPFTSALLNVKYMFADSDKYESDLYKLSGQSGEVRLYECAATLPFGYVAPVGYDISDAITNNGIRLQNKMVRELGYKENLFIQTGKSENGDAVVVTAAKDGHHYAVITAWGTSKVELVGGSLEEEHYEELQNGSVLYLGYLEKGETVILRNGDEEDATPKISVEPFRLNEELLEEVLAKLSRQHLEGMSWQSDRITGELRLEEAGRLILSVPYEDGWTVLINGEETKGVLFGESLMAFDLEPGEYFFEMTYVPKGSVAGVIVSLVSVALFVAAVIWEYLLHLNRTSDRMELE